MGCTPDEGALFDDFFIGFNSLLESVQNRLRRVAEEANYFDAVLDSMNQMQSGLENLLAEVTNYDSFSNQVDRVNQDLAVSPMCFHLRVLVDFRL